MTPRKAYTNLLIFFIFKFALMYIFRMMLKQALKNQRTEVEAQLIKTQTDR